jgi:hypothetical protein
MNSNENRFMKKNMNNTDRLIRAAFALIFAALYYNNIANNTWAVVFLVIACILAVTSFISFCPLYKLFGISTCSKKTT